MTESNFKKPMSRFTIMENCIIDDPRLSAKAKGVYFYLKSKPDNWNFSEARIAQSFKDSKDGINTAIKELERAGLLVRHKDFVTGRMRYELISPIEYNEIDLQCGKVQDGKKQDGKKQCSKSPSISNTIISNTIISNTNLSNTEEKDNNNISNDISLSSKEKTIPNHHSSEAKRPKDEVFEKLWISYLRKGDKSKALSSFAKLSSANKDRVISIATKLAEIRERKYLPDLQRLISNDGKWENYEVELGLLKLNPTKQDDFFAAEVLSEDEKLRRFYSEQGDF